MVALPTTKIKHKKTGAVRKMNTLDYAADISKWTDWKIITQSGSPATDEQVRDARREQKADEAMRRSPEREKRFGDKQRVKDERAVKASNKTAAAPEPEPTPEPVDDSWKKLKWPQLRQAVHAKTGSYPSSKKHAEELMSK
jgi:hypothetical protein